MPHLGVATLTGVAPNGIWQGDYLHKGFENLRTYGTVAPGAASRTVGAALKFIDSATRTYYGVGIGRYVGPFLHCVPFGSTYLQLLNLVLLEPFGFVHSISLLLQLAPGGDDMVEG
jgi:hypothetical protein